MSAAGVTPVAVAPVPVENPDVSWTADLLLSVPALSDSHYAEGHTKLTKKPSHNFAYRHYQTVAPCANKILQVKWDKAQQAKHRHKVKTINAHIDNKPPKPYINSQVKLKKVQLVKGTLFLYVIQGLTNHRPHEGDSKQQTQTIREFEPDYRVGIKAV